LEDAPGVRCLEGCRQAGLLLLHPVGRHVADGFVIAADNQPVVVRRHLPDDKDLVSWPQIFDFRLVHRETGVNGRFHTSRIGCADDLVFGQGIDARFPVNLGQECPVLRRSGRLEVNGFPAWIRPDVFGCVGGALQEGDDLLLERQDLVRSDGCIGDGGRADDSAAGDGRQQGDIG
jgi:hypothetical protein